MPTTQTNEFDTPNFRDLARDSTELPAGALVWVCAFCGQLRLLPYGRPFPNDTAITCAACGDLCVGDVTAARKALAHVIAQFLQ